MELQELINLKNRFDKYLKPSDYSFIGPEDQGLLNEFIQTANWIGPYDFFTLTSKMALNDEETILKVISKLPKGIPLRIYVILGEVEKKGVFLHSTIDEYCKQYNILFE